MQSRFKTVVAGVGAVIAVAAAQGSRTVLRAQQPTDRAAKPYTQPKTPWGEPDLQGGWGGRHQTTTPFERPREYAGREFLTDQEVAAKQKEEDELQAKKTALVEKGEGPDLGLQGKPYDPKQASITGYEYNTF